MPVPALSFTGRAENRNKKGHGNRTPDRRRCGPMSSDTKPPPTAFLALRMNYGNGVWQVRVHNEVANPRLSRPGSRQCCSRLVLRYGQYLGTNFDEVAIAPKDSLHNPLGKTNQDILGRLHR